MKGKRHPTEEEIRILREVDGGRAIWEVCQGKNLTVWQIPAKESKAMAVPAQRSLQFQVTVQDGSCWGGQTKADILECVSTAVSAKLENLRKIWRK